VYIVRVQVKIGVQLTSITFDRNTKQIKNKGGQEKLSNVSSWTMLLSFHKKVTHIKQIMHPVLAVLGPLSSALF